jgi:alcohol dehydrogenase class IV
VIDAAKAIAAVRGGEVAAIPTTLSGAPITAIHRLPAGHEGASGVRPSLVLADPEAMTSQPEPALRATAMNALAHGGDALFTALADETSSELSLEGARMVAAALDQPRESRDRTALTEGALLCARAVDRAGLTLHHVLGQTTVRVCGTPHAETYAALLPLTMEELARRAPDRGAQLAGAIGTTPDGIRERIAELAGGRVRLGKIGASEDCLEPALDTAMKRGELERMTPGEVTRADLERILREAW